MRYFAPAKRVRAKRGLYFAPAKQVRAKRGLYLQQKQNRFDKLTIKRIGAGILIGLVAGALLLLGKPVSAAFNRFTWVVKDQNGNPLGGALVWVNMKLRTGEWHYVSWCSTNSSGRCSVTLSSPDPAELRGDVEYQGYTGGYSGAYPDGAVIEVIINIPSPEEGVTVTGCVHHPCDPVGPVVGAHVYVLDPSTWAIIAETTTGANGCFTLTSPKSGPGYNLYIYAPSLSISGAFPLPQESGDMGTLELDADCELPGEEECPAPFPEPKECCPIVMKGSVPGWLVSLLKLFGNSIDDLFAFLFPNIHFTLVAEGPLDRSEQLPMDADFHWASFEERYDPRRIPLPEEEPEETPEGKMWPGAALRLAPPDYRPSWFWAPQRETRLKWEIPLEEYEIYDPWQGDGGKEGDRNRSAHHPLMMGAEDAWQWLINTPGLEERIGSLESSLSGTPGSSAEVDGASQLFNPPTTTSRNPTISETTSSREGPSSSQTLGVQLAQGGGVNLSATGTCSRSGNTWTINPTISLIGTTSCHAPDVSVDVYFPGGGKQTLVCGLITHKKSCTKPVSSFTVTGSPGQTVTITVSIGGNPCGPLLNNTIELTLTEDGCEGWGVGPPPPPPPEAEICNPPYPATKKDVCSDVGPRPVTVTNALRILFEQYILRTFKLFPRFTYLERISYRLAGILTEDPLFKALKEEGVGGVFNAFLPPGWKGEASLPAPNEYPTLDAPFDLKMFLDVRITAPCESPLDRRCEYTYRCDGRDVGSCTPETNEGCNPGETCNVSESCKCCLGPLCVDEFSISGRVPLGPEDDMLRIRYLGSQTEALRQTQQWLAPPQ